MRHPSDLQIYYQRNLFYAVVITIITATFSSICLMFFKNHTEPLHQIAGIQNNVNPTAKSKSKEPINALTLLSVLNPYSKQHDGFFGFVDIEISSSQTERQIIPQFDYRSTESDFSGDEFVLSYSSIAGNDTGKRATGNPAVVRDLLNLNIIIINVHIYDSDDTGIIAQVIPFVDNIVLSNDCTKIGIKTGKVKIHGTGHIGVGFIDLIILESPLTDKLEFINLRGIFYILSIIAELD